MEYDAVIFDLDGTLLESTADHFEWLYAAVEKALQELGREKEAVEMSHEELEILAGFQGYEDYSEKCRELQIEEEKMWFYITHFRARGKMRLMDENLLELKYGAESLIKYLRKQGFKLSVISNAPDTTVDEVVHFFDLTSKIEFFRGVTDLEDMKKRKPDPSHIDLAMSETKSEKPVYVGDYKFDAQAAEEMGIDSIIIGDYRNATYNVKDLHELKLLFQRS